MASLKEMRNRIGSVKATQKITKAMQMVAAAKLKRATEQAESARPYAARMAAVIANLARGVTGDGAPKLLAGTGQDKKHLIVVATADKGLAGGFNSSIVRAARMIEALKPPARPRSAVATMRICLWSRPVPTRSLGPPPPETPAARLAMTAAMRVA